VITVLLAGLGSGCAMLMESPGHVGGGATLGDAANAARPDSARKQRALDVGYTLPPEPAADTYVQGSALASESDEGDSRSGDAVARGGASSDPHVVFGLVAGGGTIGGARYDGFGEFGLFLGIFATPRLRIDALGTVSPIQFANQTLAGQSFRNEFDLNLDLTARYYLTASHTFVGVYPLAGMRMGTLFWDFATPVIVIEDDEPRTVKSDRIDHMSFYGGLGVSLVQVRHLHVGTSLIGGVRLYSWESARGFSNTLFPDVGFVQARVEAGYRF